MCRTSLSLAAWMAWAMLSLQIGTMVLSERDTRADTGELMRTLGFPAAPAMFQVFGRIEAITTPAFVVTWIWMFAAMVVALRQALEFSTLARALAVCVLGAMIVVVFALAAAVLLGTGVA